MLHSPFRRRLGILLSSFLLVGIMLSLAASQAMAQGMQHHVAAQAPISFSATITADCRLTAQTIATFSQGDVVSGTVSYVNVNDSHEASEQENLTLKETGGSFTMDYVVDSGTKSFTFTAAANNDTLTGCIFSYDGDESGTISGTIVPPSTPTPTPTTPTATSTPPTPGTTPPPPVVKNIPINGSVSSIYNTVKKVLNSLPFRLGFACTIEYFSNKVELFGAIVNDLGLLKLDFDVATSQSERLDKTISLVQALLDLIPGFGCAKAIVNIASGVGIDQLDACLHDNGCRHAIATDPQLRKELCYGVFFALEGAATSLFPILSFEEGKVCM